MTRSTLAELAGVYDRTAGEHDRCADRIEDQHPEAADRQRGYAAENRATADRLRASSGTERTER